MGIQRLRSVGTGSLNDELFGKYVKYGSITYSYNTTQTVLDITGSGVLLEVYTTTRYGGQNTTTPLRLQVIVDGTAVYDVTSNQDTINVSSSMQLCAIEALTNDAGSVLSGYIAGSRDASLPLVGVTRRNHTVPLFGGLKFNSSLKIIVTTSSNCNSSYPCTTQWWYILK
ncbi:hypothetical protein [Anoxybacteroides rupiense]|uniref:hypothetical protein n=1 Tax=Anoxybacteroides rupiense TaxID=311460 RepID=UPI001F08D1AD|nr:hypothetical protein [Anoxybacillus rupiensis]